MRRRKFFGQCAQALVVKLDPSRRFLVQFVKTPDKRDFHRSLIAKYHQSFFFCQFWQNIWRLTRFWLRFWRCSIFSFVRIVIDIRLRLIDVRIGLKLDFNLRRRVVVQAFFLKFLFKKIDRWGLLRIIFRWEEGGERHHFHDFEDRCCLPFVPLGLSELSGFSPEILSFFQDFLSWDLSFGAPCSEYAIPFVPNRSQAADFLECLQFSSFLRIFAFDLERRRTLGEGFSDSDSYLLASGFLC